MQSVVHDLKQIHAGLRESRVPKEDPSRPPTSSDHPPIPPNPRRSGVDGHIYNPRGNHQEIVARSNDMKRRASNASAADSAATDGGHHDDDHHHSGEPAKGNSNKPRPLSDDVQKQLDSNSRQGPFCYSPSSMLSIQTPARGGGGDRRSSTSLSTLSAMNRSESIQTVGSINPPDGSPNPPNIRQPPTHPSVAGVNKQRAAVKDLLPIAQGIATNNADGNGAVPVNLMSRSVHPNIAGAPTVQYVGQTTAGDDDDDDDEGDRSFSLAPDAQSQQAANNADDGDQSTFFESPERLAALAQRDADHFLANRNATTTNNVSAHNTTNTSSISHASPAPLRPQQYAGAPDVSPIVAAAAPSTTVTSTKEGKANHDALCIVNGVAVGHNDSILGDFNTSATTILGMTPACSAANEKGLTPMIGATSDNAKGSLVSAAQRTPQSDQKGIVNPRPAMGLPMGPSPRLGPQSSKQQSQKQRQMSLSPRLLLSAAAAAQGGSNPTPVRSDTLASLGMDVDDAFRDLSPLAVSLLEESLATGLAVEAEDKSMLPPPIFGDQPLANAVRRIHDERRDGYIRYGNTVVPAAAVDRFEQSDFALSLQIEDWLSARGMSLGGVGRSPSLSMAGLASKQGSPTFGAMRSAAGGPSPSVRFANAVPPPPTSTTRSQHRQRFHRGILSPSGNSSPHSPHHKSNPSSNGNDPLSSASDALRGGDANANDVVGELDLQSMGAAYRSEMAAVRYVGVSPCAGDLMGGIAMSHHRANGSSDISGSPSPNFSMRNASFGFAFSGGGGGLQYSSMSPNRRAAAAAAAGSGGVLAQRRLSGCLTAAAFEHQQQQQMQQSEAASSASGGARRNSALLPPLSPAVAIPLSGAGAQLVNKATDGDAPSPLVLPMNAVPVEEQSHPLAPAGGGVSAHAPVTTPSSVRDHPPQSSSSDDGGQQQQEPHKPYQIMMPSEGITRLTANAGPNGYDDDASSHANDHAPIIQTVEVKSLAKRTNSANQGAPPTAAESSSQPAAAAMEPQPSSAAIVMPQPQQPEQSSRTTATTTTASGRSSSRTSRERVSIIEEPHCEGSPPRRHTHTAHRCIGGEEEGDGSPPRSIERVQSATMRPVRSSDQIAEEFAECFPSSPSRGGGGAEKGQRKSGAVASAQSQQPARRSTSRVSSAVSAASSRSPPPSREDSPPPQQRKTTADPTFSGAARRVGAMVGVKGMLLRREGGPDAVPDFDPHTTFTIFQGRKMTIAERDQRVELENERIEALKRRTAEYLGYTTANSNSRDRSDDPPPPTSARGTTAVLDKVQPSARGKATLNTAAATVSTTTTTTTTVARERAMMNSTASSSRRSGAAPQTNTANVVPSDTSSTRIGPQNSVARNSAYVSVARNGGTQSPSRQQQQAANGTASAALQRFRAGVMAPTRPSHLAPISHRPRPLSAN